MKNKFLSIVATVGVLSSSSFAASSFFSVGYTMADVDGESKSGASFDYGLKFGETMKQTIGVGYSLLGSGASSSSDSGNIGNIYYNLGYEAFKDTVFYGSIGYGFQSLGSSGAGSNRTTAMSAGMSYGAGLEYSLTERFMVEASYRRYNLSYLMLDYALTTANVSLGYKF